MFDPAPQDPAHQAPVMHRRDKAGVPRVRTTARVRAHVLADEAVLAAFRVLRKPPSDAEWERILDEASRAVAHYEREDWLADPRAYHTDPPPLLEPQLRPSRAAQLRVERMKFPSAWTPPPGVPGRERWLRYRENAVGRATVLRHRDTGRPWVICLHGTEMGRDADLRSFRARRLFDEQGCNVVLPILPLHGPRRAPKQAPAGEAGAQFPTLDVLDNVHGLAHAASDVRRIISWVRTQEPSGIALLGVSLGGYVASLVAGLEREPLDGVLPIIPATDFPALFRKQSPPALRARMAPITAASEILHTPVSPLQFATSTPRARLAIAAGLADKLIDPVEQVAPLWEHWGRPSIHWYPGGHVGHLVRRDLREFVDVALARWGLARP